MTDRDKAEEGSMQSVFADTCRYLRAQEDAKLLCTNTVNGRDGHLGNKDAGFESLRLPATPRRRSRYKKAVIWLVEGARSNLLT